MSRFVVLSAIVKVIHVVAEIVQALIQSSRSNDDDEGSED